jgi:hypothetical protein
VSGSFRRASSEADIDRSDVIVNAIVELNELKKVGSKSSSRRKQPCGPGADALKDWFDDNSSSDDGDGGRPENSQYSATSFSVSLMDLANRLDMEPDRVASALYSLQKRGIISYSVADTMVYVTTSNSEISSSLRQFSMSSEFETYLKDFYELNINGSAKSGSISSTKVFLHCWMKYVSHSVNKILTRVMTDASNRVLDMWRVGCVVSSTLGGDKSLDSVNDEKYVEKGADEPDMSDKKRKVMDFLCHYMRNLSSHHEAHVMPEQHSEPSDHSAISSSMMELENAFHNVEVPIVHCSKSFRDIRNQMLKPSSESEDKWQCEFWNDAIRMIRHPRLIEFAKSITNHSPSSHKESSNVSVYHHHLVRQKSSYYNFQLIPLFIAKIFHGLNSYLLKQDEWVATGLWGKYRSVAFENIVDIIGKQLLDEARNSNVTPSL